MLINRTVNRSNRNANREYENMKQVAEGMVMLSNARSAVNELVSRYDAWIDESARLGEDAYSDKLIEEKASLRELGRMLSFIEVKIRTNAVKAKAFNELSCLNDVTNACQALLKAGPDFKKIAAGLSALDINLEKVSSPIKQLCSDLAGHEASDVDALFGKTKKSDPKLARMIEEEKKARELRLGVALANEVPAPAAADAADKVDADIDAISALIDAENRKE
jgi:hypothetical protein